VASAVACVPSRERKDQCTQDYVAKRTIESQGKLETMRCLKRYVAREIYRVLEDPPLPLPLPLLTNDLRPRCLATFDPDRSCVGARSLAQSHLAD